MRTSLPPTCWRRSRTTSGSATDVRLFEVGSVFLQSGQTLPDEPRHVAGVLCGDRPGHLQPSGPFDFFEARGGSVAVRRPSPPLEVIPAPGGFCTRVWPRGALRDRHIGVVGEVHPGC
jgi:phenylalanyl-tRNA synthetase beta subunit